MTALTIIRTALSSLGANKLRAGLTLLGIVIGMALAFGLSAAIISEIGEDFEGVEYRIPWVSTIVIFVLAYGASLLTTYLPARQASRIYPAEALRYE